MGVCYSSRVFQITKGIREQMQRDHYYIDMEEGNILFDEDIEDFIQEVREAHGDYYDGLDDDQVLWECGVIDVDYKEDYCYGIGEIDFFETKSGDIVCIVNYAY